MHSSLSFRDALVTAYKTILKNTYDFFVDPAGEYAWLEAAREYVPEYPLSFTELSLETLDDVLTVTHKIYEQFKLLMFYGVADSYCDVNNIDLTKEGNNGRGPVNFKLSRGARDKIVVETKLTMNSRLRHEVEKQLPIYMKQEKQRTPSI